MSTMKQIAAARRAARLNGNAPEAVTPSLSFFERITKKYETYVDPQQRAEREDKALRAKQDYTEYRSALKEQRLAEGYKF